MGVPAGFFDNKIKFHHWRFINCMISQPSNKSHFDGIFCRMWDYYLCYCEGGFQERAISTVQYLMAKPKARVGFIR